MVSAVALLYLGDFQWKREEGAVRGGDSGSPERLGALHAPARVAGLLGQPPRRPELRRGRAGHPSRGR
jgi:hypothetical protein